jgi:hypothetical protein
LTDIKRMKKYPDNKLSRFFRISVGIPIAYRYIAAINLDSYDTDVQPNIIAIYALLRPLFSSLFSIPATSAPPVERVFSQVGITSSCKNE